MSVFEHYLSLWIAPAIGGGILPGALAKRARPRFA